MMGRIRCAECLQTGEFPLPFEVRKHEEHHVFEYIGYDLMKGYPYFRCPGCSAKLAVSPLHLRDSGVVMGFPVRGKEERDANLTKTPLLYLLRALAHPSL
jgi:DNA-directed RNA polymerase subunit RPC12/RpoP